MNPRALLIATLALILGACKASLSYGEGNVLPPAESTHATSATTQAEPATDLPPPVPSEVLLQAKALVGLEGTVRGLIGPVKGGCNSDGSGGSLDGNLLQSPVREWDYTTFNCSGYTVLLLRKAMSGQDENTVWRVVDALALYDRYPQGEHMEEDSKEPYPWRMSGNLNNDGCEVKGLPQGTPVFGMSRRKELPDVKLAQAWVFDLKQGHIAPIDPKRVTCDYTEP